MSAAGEPHPAAGLPGIEVTFFDDRFARTKFQRLCSMEDLKHRICTTTRRRKVTAQPPPRYSGLQANLYVGTSVEEVQTRL